MITEKSEEVDNLKLPWKTLKKTHLETLITPQTLSSFLYGPR